MTDQPHTEFAVGKYDDALEIAKEKKDTLNIIRVADRLSELKQKHIRVEEHYDEEVEELPSARPPTPKLIENGIPDTVKC